MEAPKIQNSTAQESPNAVDAYTVATEEDRQQALDRLMKAVRRLRYLEIVRYSSDGAMPRMLEIHLHCRRCSFMREMIQADFREVWARDVAGDMNSICNLRERPDGFEYRFALLPATGKFITGAVVVDLDPDIAKAA